MDIDLACCAAFESEKTSLSTRPSRLNSRRPARRLPQVLVASVVARVDVDMKAGNVHRLAIRLARTGPRREYDDTPAAFGRIAATPRPAGILQRLRDVEDTDLRRVRGRVGDIVPGDPQGKDPRTVLVDMAIWRRCLPGPPSRGPASATAHVRSGSAATFCNVASPPRTLGHPVPGHHPGLVTTLFGWRWPEIATGRFGDFVAIAGPREAGHRPRSRVLSHRQGGNPRALHRPDGSRVRNVMNELHGEKIDIVDYSTSRPSSCQRACGPGSRVTWWTPRPGGPGPRADYQRRCRSARRP